MSNATNLSKLANLLDDGTTGQALVSDGASNVAFETLSTSNVGEGTNLYFTDERVQTKLASVSGNVVPDTNVAYDLGSAAYAFKDLYLSGSTINLGSLQLSDNGGSLEISPIGGGSAEPFATEAYVTTQVNNLVDAAPGTLDTLNELAAALGDDANFSTTVTNSIAAKANTSSLSTVATSGSYNDLSNQPTIPTMDTSVTTVSSPTANLDLSNSNFKIDLNSNSTTVTTSNNPSTGLHEYTFEIKGNASQDTHNLQSNPSNAITNWRTAQQSSITGFTIGASQYNAFAASPDGQYAAAYQAYSSSNKQLTIFKMSTPGDVTTATSHLVINNISVSAGGRTDHLGMRPSIYFLSDNVTINMFGKTYNAETGSNNNNGAGSNSPFYEYANKGNWTPDGLHFYAITGDPSFRQIKRWDATAPFDWSTASLVSTTTMPSQSGSVINYYGPDKAVHVSGDGTKLITVGKYISNNHSNFAMDTYSLSTPFDPASATYVGQYTVANGGAIHFGSFTNDGNTYMYSDDDRLKSFTNLATTPVLNTITWPTNFYWEGGSAPTATPNDETDIVRFATTDSGSTFNAWVEKDSDKSAGFDGQYSSLTGAPTLATVATSGSYNDLTNQPTIPTNNNQLTNGAGYVTSAQLGEDNTVVSYSSTSSASANDVMMLNTDGTVTPIEVTTFPTAVNGAAPQIVPSSTRLAGSTNDGSVVGDAPNHLFKLDGNKYLSVGRHEGGASGFYGVYSAVAEYNSGSWTWGNVYDMNNTNWGTVNWNSEYYNDPYVLRSPDNPDKFLFFKLRTGGSFAAIIGTVNGLTISWSDYSQPSQNYPSSINNQYNVRTEYDYAGSSAGNYKFIVWYGTASDMKAFRVVWDGDTTITWEDEVTISTGGIGAVPNGNINPVSASFSRVTEGRLCVHNYTAGSLQVYDIDWVNGTTQVGNNFSITASSSTSGTSNYYGVDVKTAWNPLTDEVISINRLASGTPNIRFRRYSVDATRTITANGAEFSPGGGSPFYSSSTYWLNGDFKFFPKSNVMFFSHARKDGSYDLNAIHYLSTDNASSFTQDYGIWTNYGLSGMNWPFSARMYPDPFSSGQGSMSYTDRTSGVSRLEGKPLQGEYVESNLDKSKIHGLAATSGTTPDVTTQFGVHSGLSGLTVGSKYYVLDDGTLSTTPDTHNAKIGVAVKSTHIALDFIDELTENDLTTYATKSYVATQTFSGSYNDLTNKPTIPANTSQLANNSGFITAASLSGYATETYVNTATANLVDSAPATLDTLNELAAALGDDANFSTTILAQLGAVSANTISNASNINAVQANLSASASTAAVTVSGGNFYIDGAQQTTISLEPGRTYKFDQSDSTNSSHPLRFSTTVDGTHGGGSEYTTGVTTSGTAGSANAYVQIAIDNSTPALYYYCANHSGMGAAVSVGNPFNTDELSEGTSNLYYTDARVDARISGGVSANLNITSSPIKKYARLELTATQSISSSTATRLNYNTRSEDTSTANLLTATLADGKFIIPAGVTKVSIKASAQGSSVTDQFILKVMKNGSNAVTTNFDIASTGGDFPAVFTGIESVVEGDYFQVFGYSQNSRTVVPGSYTWFELEVLEGSILDTTVSANVALADLNNVSNAAPADGQALIWNTSQSNWAPANVAAGGSSVSVSDTAPSSPSNGDQWFNSADGSMYIYYADGSSNQWVSVSGPAGSSVSVGTTPPTGAANGDQWFNSDSATLYVYYADGSSSQWVAVSGPTGPQGPAAENAVTTGKAIAMSIVFG